MKTFHSGVVTAFASNITRYYKYIPVYPYIISRLTVAQTNLANGKYIMSCIDGYDSKPR